MKNSITGYLQSASTQTKDNSLSIEEGDNVTLFYFGDNAPVMGRYITEDEDVIVLGIYTDGDMKKTIEQYAAENNGMVPVFSMYSKQNLKSITKNSKHG